MQYKRGEPAEFDILLVEGDGISGVENAKNIMVAVSQDGKSFKPIPQSDVTENEGGWYKVALDGDMTNADRLVIQADADDTLQWRDIHQAQAIHVVGAEAEKLKEVHAFLSSKAFDYNKTAEDLDTQEGSDWEEMIFRLQAKVARQTAEELGTAAAMLSEIIEKQAKVVGTQG